MSKKFKSNKTKISSVMTKINSLKGGTDPEHISRFGKLKNPSLDVKDVPGQEILLQDLHHDLTILRKASDYARTAD